MQVIIHGWDKEPERFGRDAREVDLVVEVGDENISLQIEEKVISITLSDFRALQRLASE